LKKLNGAWTRVSIQRLGPVKGATITIRPITILIGKNCYGKSLLLNLLYLLSDLTPDFDKLQEAMAEKDLFQLAEEAYNALQGVDRQAVSSLLTEMFHRIFESLDIPYAETFKEKFKDFFEVESMSSLFYGGCLKVERILLLLTKYLRG